MKFETYKCDICGALKGETNHWWLRQVSDNSVYFLLSTRLADHDAVVSAQPLDLRAPTDDKVQHICSEQCATKALSQWMAAR
jgi:hypothetical protein